MLLQQATIPAEYHSCTSAFEPFFHKSSNYDIDSNCHSTSNDFHSSIRSILKYLRGAHQTKSIVLSLLNSPLFEYVIENEFLSFIIERIFYSDKIEYEYQDPTLMSFYVCFTIIIKKGKTTQIKIKKRLDDICSFFKQISQVFDFFIFSNSLFQDLCFAHETLCKKLISKKSQVSRIYNSILSYVKPIFGGFNEDLSISILLFWENVLISLVNIFRRILVSTSIWESNAFVNYFELPNFNLVQKDYLSRYILLKVLGKGSIGKVFLAADTQTSALVAIKSIHKSSIRNFKELEHSYSEKRILMELLKNENMFIIHLLSSFQNSTELFYVLPYYSGGDLATSLSKNRVFSEQKAKFIAAQIVLGLEHLYSKGIIYRDLKPENILFGEDGFIALVDFGLSKIVSHDSFAMTFCGTYDYLAPEILQGHPYNHSVDIWSFGIVLYEMIVGITPFWNEDNHIMCKNIIYSPLDLTISRLSSEAKSLINLLLIKDSYLRLSIEKIKKHSFFNDINWENLSRKHVQSPYQPQKDLLVECINFDPIFTTLPAVISPPTTDSNNNFISIHLDRFSFDGDIQQNTLKLC